MTTNEDDRSRRRKEGDKGERNSLIWFLVKLTAWEGEGGTRPHNMSYEESKADDALMRQRSHKIEAVQS